MDSAFHTTVAVMETRNAQMAVMNSTAVSDNHYFLLNSMNSVLECFSCGLLVDIYMYIYM